MGEQSILELAKLGNANAIADLMNQSLQQKGVSCKVKISGDRLYVFVESSHKDRQAVVALIRQGTINLNVKSLKIVKIYGRQLGENTAAWNEEFDLVSQAKTPSPASFSHVETNGNDNSIKHQSLSKLDGLKPKNPQPPKKLSGLFRHFKILIFVFITFALTTLIWDKWGFFKPLNYRSELSKLLEDWVSLVNQRTATISGGAWVTKEAGTSDILRGLEIALCKANVKPEIRRVRDNKWRESISKYKTPIGYWHLNIEAMNAKVASHKDCFQVVKTGIEGKYTIPDVPFGTYFIYAPYETSFAKAYWMIPIQVQSNKTIQIDLDNSNMMELYNRD